MVVRGLSEHRGPPTAAAALYEEDGEGRRVRERLAEQLRVAPSLRYQGKGRPTKRERREIEKLRGEVQERYVEPIERWRRPSDEASGERAY